MATVKYQVVLILIMGTLMSILMTFVVTTVNVGWGDHFLGAWATAFAIAYPVAVPVLFIVTPLARRITTALVGRQELGDHAR